MDKNTIESLKIDYLVENLPFRKKNYSVIKKFNFSVLDDLKKHYHRLAEAYDYFMENKSLDRLLSYLKEVEDLDVSEYHRDGGLTIEALFILKKNLYYWNKIRKEFSYLTEVIVGESPQTDILWAILNGDQCPRPVFLLKDLGDEKYCKILMKIEEVESKIDLAWLNQKKKVEAEWGIEINNDFYSFSNTEHEEYIGKLVESGDFRVKEKNYVNTILMLQETPTIKREAAECRDLKNQLEEMEEKILDQTRKRLAEQGKLLMDFNDFVNTLEIISVGVAYMKSEGCVIPRIDSQRLKILKGRWVPLAADLKAKGISYQPLIIDCRRKGNVISGMNMGGKSVLIKTIGYMAFHLKLGLPVPCEECVIPFFDNVFFEKGVSKEKSCLSTFATEMMKMEGLLKREGNDLYLFDEIIKGTNPVEAKMIIQAVAKYILGKKQWFFLSTHSHIFNGRRMEGVDYYVMAGFKNDDEEIIERLKYSHRRDIIKMISRYIDYQPRKTNRQEVPQKARTICRLLGLDDTILEYIDKEYEEYLSHSRDE